MKKRNKADLPIAQQIFQDAIRSAIPDEHLPGSEWENFSQDPDNRESVVNQRMADQLRRVASAPGGQSFIAIANAFHAQMIVGEDADKFGDLITGLDSILLRASRGEERALKQLHALDRIVFAEDYGLKLTDLEKILKFDIDESLARAWDLLEIMRRISFVVEPKEPTKPNGLVVRKQIQVTNAEGGTNWEVQQCGRELYELLHDKKLYDKLWATTRRPTLKTVAMTLYQELSPLKVNRETLSRDLKAAQKWQARNLAGYQKLLPRGVRVGKNPFEVEINYIPLRRTRWLVHKRPKSALS